MEAELETRFPGQEPLRWVAFSCLPADVPQPHRASPRPARRLSASERATGAGHLWPIRRRHSWFLTLRFCTSGDARAYIDLNAYVLPGSDLVVTDGETMNDRGEIAGSGKLPNGDFHAIVLTPCGKEVSDAEGCQDARNTDTGAKTNLAPLAGNQTGANHGPLTPEALNAIRDRFTRRYRNFGKR